MAEKIKGVKAPINPLYEAMPYVFTTVGNVRRIVGAPRFSRTRMGEAVRVEFEMKDKQNLIINNGETSFVLSEAQTKLLKGQDIISDMYLNGWQIEEAPLFIVEFFKTYKLIEVNNG